MLRKTILLATICCAVFVAINHRSSSAQTIPEYHPDDLMRHIMFFCHPDLKGRLTGSPGERKALAYVADRFAALKIRPDGDLDDDGNRSWFQKFDYPAGAEIGEDCKLAVADRNYRVDEDWRPLTFSKAGKFEPGEVVFAGYGIVAEKDGDQSEYNSFVHLDVNDKWVMVFRHMPEDVADETRQFLTMRSSLQRKAMNLRDMGARGMIVVSGPNSHFKEKLIPLGRSFSRGQTSLGAISISDELAAEWLKKSGQDLKEIQTTLDKGEQVMGFTIKGLQLAATVDVKQNRGIGHNIVGRLQVGKNPSQEVIVIGAHVDHLGEGRSASSRAKADETTLIHFGADDNASGVAAMMEIAEFIADKVAKGETTEFKRDFVFAGWSGEELGLHGSKHFVNELLELNNKTRLADAEPQIKPKSDSDPGAVAAAHDISVEDVRAIINNLTNNYSDMTKDEVRSEVTSLKLMSSLMKNGVAEFDRLISETTDEEQLQQLRKQKKNLTNVVAEAQAILEMAAKHDGEHDNPATAAQTAAPADTIYPAVAAYLNMDMVGRYRDQIVLQGLGSSEDWGSLIERANFRIRLNVKKELDTNLPTDATNFYRAGVPIIAAFTKSHTDYHTPRDTPDKINSADATRIAKLIGNMATALSKSDTAIRYQRYDKVESTRSGGVMGIVYLGTHPDYGYEGTGVKLVATSEGSPARKAGLRNGDIVIALGGGVVENMDQYMIRIGALKIGKETTVVVKRGEKEVTLKIVPGVKE